MPVDDIQSAGIGSALPDQTGASTYILTTNGVTASWEAVSGVSGVTTMAAVGSTPSANGASIAGNDLTLQPADGTHPGVLTSGTQTIGGAKTFSGAITASNLSGTNTGDITLSAFGSTPDAKGAILTGQALALQPADATHPGLVTTGTQTFAGDKTIGGSLISTTAAGGFGTNGIKFNADLTGVYYSSANMVFYAAGTTYSWRLGGGFTTPLNLTGTSADFSGLGAGGSIKLKSPDSTTYTITIANGGTLVIS